MLVHVTAMDGGFFRLFGAAQSSRCDKVLPISREFD